MGLLDRFKKSSDTTTTKEIENARKRVQEMNAESLDERYRKSMEYFAEEDRKRQEEMQKINASFSEINNRLSGGRYANQVAREEAGKILREFAAKEFDQKYAEIIGIKGKIDNSQFWLNAGFSPKVLNIFAKEIKYVQLPVLLEKEAVGCINRSDALELQRMLGSIKTEKNDLNTMYVRSLVILQMLGAIDIRDTSLFEKTFDEYAVTPDANGSGKYHKNTRDGVALLSSELESYIRKPVGEVHSGNRR